MIITQTDIV